MIVKYLTCTGVEVIVENVSTVEDGNSSIMIHPDNRLNYSFLNVTIGDAQFKSPAIMINKDEVSSIRILFKIEGEE